MTLSFEQVSQELAGIQRFIKGLGGVIPPSSLHGWFGESITFMAGRKQHRHHRQGVWAPNFLANRVVLSIT